MRRLQCLLPAAILLLVSCGPRYSSAALGHYDDFQPLIILNSAVQVELARPAYVALLAVRPPAGGYHDRPVVIDVQYPQYETDRLHFPAGRHRLLPRRTTDWPPRNCPALQKPSLAGCRRAERMLPGLIGGRPPSNVTHYILIASDEFIDPYTLADELYFAAAENPALSEALRNTDADVASPLLERTILDRPGTPYWSALYVTTR